MNYIFLHVASNSILFSSTFECMVLLDGEIPSV